MPKPVLSAGERVLCRNGHHVFSVARDTMPGEPIPASDMTDRQDGFEPRDGEAMGGCRRCGAPFVMCKTSPPGATPAEERYGVAVFPWIERKA